jgi:hypothetical protein
MATAKRVPPYLPFKTFLNSLDTLSQGVPPKLDRSFWKQQSGVNQGLIMNAYRYFYLVDANDASTEYLATLAHHPDKRAATMKKLISDQYLFVLEKADITKSTLRMLEDAFEEVYAVTGDTKQKAITFFLKAAKFADLPLSPYLLNQLRDSAKKPRRNRPRAEQINSEKDSNIVSQASGLSSHTVQLAGGGRLTITISANPFTMPADDRNFFFSLVDMLHKYGAEHPESQESTEENEEEIE